MFKLFQKFGILVTLVFAFGCSIGQAQINPEQIRWPLLTGTGVPTLSCSSVNYGQPYQNTAVTPNTYYTCGTDGWQIRISLGPKVNATSVAFGAASSCANTADPTMTLDSTCAIRAAIAYVYAHGANGVYPALYLPVGNYKTTAEIRIPCDVWLEGDGVTATVISLTNNAANGITVYGDNSGSGDAWQCVGGMHGLGITAIGAHLYTADQLEIVGSTAYTLRDVLVQGGGGRGINVTGGSERLDAENIFINTVRWPMLWKGNENHLRKLNIADPGNSSDNWCFAQGNCVTTHTFPNFNWSLQQTLVSAVGSGTRASYVVTDTGGAGSTLGVSPIGIGQWFTVSGVTGTTGLNGVFQVASATNGTVTGGCAANRCYTITAVNSTSGTGTGLGSATFQPTIVADRNAAVYASGSTFKIDGGSIKSLESSGCFDIGSTFGSTIANIYCEGYPVNGQPHVNSSVTEGNLPAETTTTASLGASATTVTVVDTSWFPNYVQTASDANSADIIQGKIAPCDYIEPPNTGYNVQSACAPTGVLKGMWEAVQITMTSTGALLQRCQSGSTVTCTAYTSGPVWPSGSLIANGPPGNYSYLKLDTDHFNAIDEPGANWAAYCNDQSSFICGEIIGGGIENGLTTGSSGSTLGRLQQAQILFDNDEWWGGINSASPGSSYYGDGTIKAVGLGIVAQATGSTFGNGYAADSNAVNGKFTDGTANNVNDSAPGFVNVQSADTYYPSSEYNNLSNGMIFSASSGLFRKNLNAYGDPITGNNPGAGSNGYNNGAEVANSTCTYDTPLTSGTHSLNRWCFVGGPGNSGTAAGVEYDTYNTGSSIWVTQFKIDGTGAITFGGVPTFTDAIFQALHMAAPGDKVYLGDPGNWLERDNTLSGATHFAAPGFDFDNNGSGSPLNIMDGAGGTYHGYLCLNLDSCISRNGSSNQFHFGSGAYGASDGALFAANATFGGTLTALNGSINSVMNGATAEFGMSSYLTAPCTATVANTSHVVTILSGCTFPSPMTGYVFHLGDSVSGSLDGTLTYLSPTTATMNVASTWTSSSGISATVNAGGTGYAVGDTGTVNGGNSNARYWVQSVSGGVVTGIYMNSGGSGYTSATGVATATGGIQPGSGTGLTLNTTAALTPETLYFGPDNCTSANAWFAAASGGRGTLSPGVYMSSCPLLQGSANSFFIEGTTKTNTILVDADSSSHPDFIGVGNNGSNSVSHIANISAVGNKNTTRGCISIFGPTDHTSQDFSCYDSGAASLYLNNAVSANINQFSSAPSNTSIVQPVNCVNYVASGPSEFHSLTCEGASGYSINNTGQMTITASQIDYGLQGQLYNSSTGYVYINGGTLLGCELTTCANGVTNYGVVNVEDGGVSVSYHGYSGSIFYGSNVALDGLNSTFVFDSGSLCTIAGLRLGLNGITDNAGCAIAGPTVNESTGVGTVDYPTSQSLQTGIYGNQLIMASGPLAFRYGCATYGNSSCNVTPMAQVPLAASTTWAIQFQGQWNTDTTVPFIKTVTYASPTFTVAGQTVTCKQATTNFNTTRSGQFVCYIAPSSIGQVGFTGSWIIYPNGMNTPTGLGAPYCAAGICNSTGTAWGSSYGIVGSGSNVVLATSPTLQNSLTVTNAGNVSLTLTDTATGTISNTELLGDGSVNHYDDTAVVNYFDYASGVSNLYLSTNQTTTTFPNTFNAFPHGLYAGSTNQFQIDASGNVTAPSVNVSATNYPLFGNIPGVGNVWSAVNSNCKLSQLSGGSGGYTDGGYCSTQQFLSTVPGWNDLGTIGAYLPAAQSITMNNYSTGIESVLAIQVNSPAGGDQNGIDFQDHVRNALNHGGDQGQSDLQIQSYEGGEPTGTVTSVTPVASGVQVALTCSANCDQMGIMSGPLVDMTEAIPATVTYVSTSGGLATVTSSNTVPVSTSGTLASAANAQWSNATTYPSGIIVLYIGAAYYQSLQNTNVGHEPDTSPSWWTLVSPPSGRLSSNIVTWNMNTGTTLTAGELCGIGAGDASALYEITQLTSVGTPSGGVQSVTANLYNSHAIGEPFSCGGMVGWLAIYKNYEPNGQMYADNIYASTGVNTLIIGHRAANFYTNSLPSTFAEPVAIVPGADIVGVTNPSTGNPDGGFAYTEPAPSGTYTVGHSIVNLNNISATYTNSFMDTNINNPFAERNTHANIFQGNFLGGGANVNTGFNYNFTGNGQPSYDLNYLGNGANITAWSISGANVATFTGNNNFLAGQKFRLGGFGTSTFFNGQVVTILSSGLSSTQFEANFTHSSGSGTEAGNAQGLYLPPYFDYVEGPISAGLVLSGWPTGPAYGQIGVAGNSCGTFVLCIGPSGFGPDSLAGGIGHLFHAYTGEELDVNTNTHTFNFVGNINLTGALTYSGPIVNTYRQTQNGGAYLAGWAGDNGCPAGPYNVMGLEFGVPPTFATVGKDKCGALNIVNGEAPTEFRMGDEYGYGAGVMGHVSFNSSDHGPNYFSSWLQSWISSGSYGTDYSPNTVPYQFFQQAVGTSTPVNYAWADEWHVFNTLKGFKTQQVQPLQAIPVATGSTTGGTLAANQYSFVITGTTTTGETTASQTANCVTTTGSTSSISLTWTAMTGATGYKVYPAVGNCAGGQAGTANAAFTVSGTSYTFTAFTSGSVVPPTENTTGYGIDASGNATVASLSATSNITDSALTPGNCVQAGTGGLLIDTGGPCYPSTYKVARYWSIPSATFSTGTFLGPIYFYEFPIGSNTPVTTPLMASLTGTISCSVAPTIGLYDLGTSATTALGSSALVTTLATGTSDGAYTASASFLGFHGQHYYRVAFTAGSCTTAPQIDFTVDW